MRGLYRKTEGVFAELRAGLSGCKGIQFAFIFGSFARGAERPRSDIDLLVVGSISDAELAKMVFSVQRNYGREINYILWSFDTLEEKIGNKSPFMGNILSKGLVWLAGDYDEFVRIAAQKPGP
ncbi:nucleotidyltransferase domain-containing protein [Candidatus Micrarchaeota archaeon]|nr:nucleotidyltransferase domain-containing protein [Candidatus Micrarchaeota archaeon]